jgi:hypothetical protein
MKRSHKTLLALTSIGLVGAGSYAFAQTAPTATTTTNTNSNQTRPMPPEFTNLTASQKATLEQARTLFESGKQSEAKTLLDNAGIKMPPRGERGGPGGMHGNMKAVDDAIVAGDYTAFKTAAANGPLANIDQTTFNSLKAPVEAKRAAESQIQTILKNAGVSMPTPGQAQVNTTSN